MLRDQMIQYYTCVRILLYPQLSDPNIDSQYLLQCAEACGGVCESYKQMHHLMLVDYSPLALQGIFLAGVTSQLSLWQILIVNVSLGLTLIYCMWQAPKFIMSASTTDALTDCSIMLYVISERWPSAKRYRDSFEGVKRCVVNLIAQGNQEPRKVVSGLTAEMRTTMESLEPHVVGNVKRDLTQIVGHITGEEVGVWTGEDLSMGAAPWVQEGVQLSMDGFDTAFGGYQCSPNDLEDVMMDWGALASSDMTENLSIWNAAGETA